MIDYNIGQLIRLCRPSTDTSMINFEVSVFIVNQNEGLKRKTYPVNTIGMILNRSLNGIEGVYHVLIENDVAFITDSYIKPFNPDEVIFDYDIEDLEITEFVTM